MIVRHAVVCLFIALASAAAGDDAPGAWSGLVESATMQYGLPGRRAAQFLVDHHPARDAAIDRRVLDETIAYAMRVRDEFPWTSRLSTHLFHNAVLPYASLDEARELWRKELYELCKPFVADCTTASQAAHEINRRLFDALGVRYDTSREKPNQSPSESIAQGRASCTGLAILLVDACRSVGIPARIAGVSRWRHKEGNHTWVEIWDEGWHFLGAAEPDPRGVDHAWFVQDAVHAIPGDETYAIRAVSFAAASTHFPLVWNDDDTGVPGVDVTERYLSPFKGPNDGALRFVRLWTTQGGERVWGIVTVLEADGTCVGSFTTRAGGSDLNDMPSFNVIPGAPRQLIVQCDGKVRGVTVATRADDVQTLDLYWDSLTEIDDPRFAPMRKSDAEAFVAEAAARWGQEIAGARAEALKAGVLQGEFQALRFIEKTVGDAPTGGRSLWISLHGGGNAPTELNDSQWRKNIDLYEPAEGIVVSPRAPSDTWNLWHQGHVDPLFDLLIETMVASRGVNPNRVYLLGYSAGGDGVYQLAPRMADRFAAASMMAGHPNEAEPLGLRNLPFAIFVGAEDDAYGRNAIAAEWGRKLDALHAEDASGYTHRTTIYPGLGHWMDGRDKEALPWMAGFVRNPWPERVVWYQDDVTHERFYWLKIDDADARGGATIRAVAKGRTITIGTTDVTRITLRLRDGLVDLDEPVRVVVNGETLFEGKVPRTRTVIEATLAERFDAPAAATAELPLAW